MKIKSFECPKSIRNYENNNAWNIRHLIDLIDSFLELLGQGLNLNSSAPLIQLSAALPNFLVFCFTLIVELQKISKKNLQKLNQN